MSEHASFDDLRAAKQRSLRPDIFALHEQAERDGLRNRVIDPKPKGVFGWDAPGAPAEPVVTDALRKFRLIVLGLPRSSFVSCRDCGSVINTGDRIYTDGPGIFDENRTSSKTTYLCWMCAGSDLRMDDGGFGGKP